jgi:hypothetical protein
MTPKIKLILDSGAFSAYTRKKTINIKEYADFILANRDVIDKAVNLDVISPDDPEGAAKSSWDNYCYLRDRGIDVLPVYHSRENLKWLDKILEVTNYIGLGASSLRHAQEAGGWYDLVFNYATDIKGRPIADFHVFGDTTPNTLIRYPWKSADSNTAIRLSRGGGCMLLSPTENHFAHNYEFNTNKHRQGSNVIRQETDDLLKRGAFDDILRRHGLNPKVIGKTLSKNESILLRSFVNCSYLLELRMIAANTTTFKRTTNLLDIKAKKEGKERIGPPDIYFISVPNTFKTDLTVYAHIKGADHLLLSYFYLCKDAPRWQIARSFVFDPVGTCEKVPDFSPMYNFLAENLLEVAK